VKTLLHTIAHAFFHAGGLGLLTLGIRDSSLLVLPVGNDLLVLALCARFPQRVLYYVAMATLGSVIGSFTTDWVGRKSEGKLKKYVPSKHMKWIRVWVEKRAALTLVVSALLPPPFPFTAIVAAAAAFRYPRAKLLSFVAAGRVLRFGIEAALAVHYGHWIVAQAKSPLLERVMLTIIVLSIVGTSYSIYRRRAGNKTTAAVRTA
jgi:membrane protein YqaA with SNARE-associated domain